MVKDDAMEAASGGAAEDHLTNDSVFPASSVQQRLWLLEQIHPGGGLYNSPFAYRISGALDEQALHKALESIVERHEVLRTTFVASGGRVVQRLHATGSCPFRVVDAVDETAAIAMAVAEARQPFDLAAGPLIRSALFRLSTQQRIFVVTVHHTVFDGWSESILLAELGQFYQAELEQSAAALPELPIQYADYAAWEQEQLEGSDLDQDVAYWRAKLADLNPSVLPLDHPRSARDHGRGAWEPVRIPPALTSSVKAFAARESASLFMVLAAGLLVLLRRYTRQEDTAVGFVTSGRERVEVQSLIGCFINTLVLRLELGEGLTPQDVVHLTRRAALEAYDHQALPFDRLIELLPGRRDGSRPAAFQVLINQGPPVRRTSIVAGMPFEQFPLDLGVSKFDLSLEIGEVDGGFEGYFEYNTELFEPATVRRFSRHFSSILQGFVDQPSRPISMIPLLSDEDRAGLLLQARGAAPATVPVLVHRQFEAQVAANPDTVAVAFGESSVTYCQLDRRANVLAHALVDLGLEAGGAVGVVLPRSIDAIASLLAVFKAGGVYVPIDPGYPDERMFFALHDADVKVVITTDALRRRLPVDEAAILTVDAIPGASALHQNVSEERLTTGDSGAYVLYTSGSTGTPKGVLVGHRALASHTAAVVRQYGLSAADVVLQFAGFSLDPSLEQILPTLAVGGTLVLRGEGVWGGVECFQNLVRHRVTVADFPTAYWTELVQVALDTPSSLTGHCLRLVLVGGEAMPLPGLETWWQTPLAPVRLLNVYGPTEATVTATCYEVRQNDPYLRHQAAVPIGRPLDHRHLYILDEHRQLMPPGAPGEVYLGGAGLAERYLNRPELTDERFPTDPFVGRGSRMYRTGDVGRYLPDGNVVFLGRVDDQVKIRGFRIEPAEVEGVLASARGVAAAAVVVKGEAGASRHLAAFVVLRGGESVSAEDLRRDLLTTLPDFMVPRTITVLDQLPLASSGKVDRRALKALVVAEELVSPTPAPASRPATEAEQRLAVIWCDVLELPAVNPTDDFFAIGGHSLLAIRLVTAVAEEFNVELPLEALFEAPTLAAMAQRIGREAGLESVVTAGASRRDTESETERTLVALWETVLGVSPIGVNDSFLELQEHCGDRVAPMFDGVREIFGVLAEGLPVEEFIRDPTVANLARLLDSGLDRHSALVVPLHLGGTGTPLFLVHAGGGYVFFYRALAARLGRPVYGIRAATDDDSEPFSRAGSLEDLAARYLREIRALHPEGRYHLGGACFGGVVAFEMARQLVEQGDRIEGPVLLLDSFVQNNSGAKRDVSREAHSRSEYLQKRMRTHFERSRQLGLLGGVRYLSEKLRSNAGDLFMAVPAGLSELSRRLSSASAKLDVRLRTRDRPDQPAAQRAEERQLRLIASFMEATDRLLLRYWPQQYQGPVALLGANEAEDPRLMWAGLAPDDLLFCCRLQGDHMTMFDEPAVADTAAWIRFYLDGTEHPG
jgi:amino acid adenylation domain-containing protein